MIDGRPIPSNGHPVDSAIARQFDRLPPNDTDAEMCLLGSMLLDRRVIAPCLELVDRDVFFLAANQVIFDMLVGLYRDGSPIDGPIVRDELKKRGVYEEVGADGYLGAPSRVLWRQMRDAAMRRAG